MSKREKASHRTQKGERSQSGKAGRANLSTAADDIAATGWLTQHIFCKTASTTHLELAKVKPHVIVERVGGGLRLVLRAPLLHDDGLETVLVAKLEETEDRE